jgi:DNA-directed RNA polymerase specialized sigma24 family protein
MATFLTPTVKIMADSCVSWLVDLALSRLAKIDPRIAQVVELRYFGGLSNEEIAAVLQVSAITVIRSWNLARVWLLRELGGTAETQPAGI